MKRKPVLRVNANNALMQVICAWMKPLEIVSSALILSTLSTNSPKLAIFGFRRPLTAEEQPIPSDQ